MNLETIGASSLLSGELEQPDSGVRFRIPYGEVGYDITLSNEEIDKILGIGLGRLYRNTSISASLGFDAEVDLPNGNLGVYIGLKGIDTKGYDGLSQDVSMKLVAVTQSVVYEHRGILDVKRPGWNGLWQYLGYQALPPLKNIEAA